MSASLKMGLIIILIALPSMMGCIDLDDTFSFFDKELRRAQPYLDKIVFDDETIRSYALQICQNCSHSNKEQIINTLYRYIVEEYAYISDPFDEELIRSPQQTINIKGGDCEDLSILLMSLLENLDIKTYLVLTKDHAYALAYDINIENLWPYVEQSLINQVEKESGENLRQIYHQTFTLKKRQNWYYGGDGESIEQSESFDYMNISYDITSTRPITMYVVSSKDDFHNYTNDEDFKYYAQHYYEKEREMQGICGYMKTSGGIILSNPTWVDAQVTVNFSFYSHPSFYKLFENKTIRSYTIQGKQCIVLEPTAGVYGYPGYDANVSGKKTAIDPITKDYFYLK